MFIAHYNTYSTGGAAVLMKRLHRELRGQGHESRIFIRHGDASAADSKQIDFASSGFLRIAERAKYSIENRLVGASPASYFSTLSQLHRTPLDTKFGMPDVVHLHWVSRWLDLPSFLHHVPESVPIVWTIHDLSPVSGGCFTYSGCEGFTDHCRSCPLMNWPWSHILPSSEIRRKKRVLKARQLHVVGNSEFTAGLARRSSVFSDAASVSVIPPGLATAEYQQHPRGLARSHFRIPEDRFVLGFCAADLTDENKGLYRFLEILALLRERIPGTTGLLIGNSKAPIDGGGVPLVLTGALTDPYSQSLAYSAMNAFVLCSRMETFGQVAIEAQACGTPVWAYDVGGVRDAIGPGGKLVPFNDVQTMCVSLAEARDSGAMVSTGDSIRAWVVENFDTTRIAGSYLTLYSKALQS